MTQESVSMVEAQRMVREALARQNDNEVMRVADSAGERLAVLEIEVRHVRDGQEKEAQTAKEERAAMQVELALTRMSIQQLKDVLTKAAGMKLAFMLFVGGLGVIVAQFWNLWGALK